MRLFVGIKLAGPAQDAILAAREKLVEAATRQGVRFVRPDKLHLTLCFLGDVDESTLDDLKAALDKLASLPSFTLHLTALGGFPDLGRPKVVWIGLEGDAGTLAEAVASATKPFAPQQDDKPYSPHVTLARVSPGSKEVGRIVSRLDMDLGSAELPVGSFVLFQSKPDGTYEALHEVRLESAAR